MNREMLMLVEAISREISELLNRGIELNSRSPEYYYTKLAELKLDLLQRAAKSHAGMDALLSWYRRERAEAVTDETQLRLESDDSSDE